MKFYVRLDTMTWARDLSHDHQECTVEIDAYSRADAVRKLREALQRLVDETAPRQGADGGDDGG